MEQKDLVSETKKLREKMDLLIKKYSLPQMFLGGMLRGAGILVGATLLVLIGGSILNVLGFLPGLSEIAEIIANAFEKAKLQ